MSEPREFRCFTIYDDLAFREKYNSFRCIEVSEDSDLRGDVRVIEYSAYESIKAERDRYKKALELISSEKMNPSGPAYGAKKIAREALTQFEGALSES